MATKVKTPNYTPEQTAKMVEDYKNGVSVEAIATALSKSAKSIVAKLVRENVYVAKTKAETDKKVGPKSDVAKAIGAVLKMDAAETASLEGANKTALAKIFAALANSVPMTPENDKASAE